MNNKDRENLEKLVYAESIARITSDIETHGELKVWTGIEAISNPRARLKYREIFFKAGGIVPETEINI
jgi:hypothetical protein